MTKQDKQLLLVDLCGRLPYGVKCYIDNTIPPIPSYSDYENGKVITKPVTVTGLSCENKMECIEIDDKNFDGVTIKVIKPYLRPMSSMTEEEKEKCNGSIICYNEFEGNSTLFDTEGLDYLNKNMFDYRGLIEKGLALEAPDGMYRKEEIE